MHLWLWGCHASVIDPNPPQQHHALRRASIQIQNSTDADVDGCPRCTCDAPSATSDDIIEASVLMLEVQVGLVILLLYSYSYEYEILLDYSCHIFSSLTLNSFEFI